MGNPARLFLRPVAAKLKKSKDFFTKMDPYLIIKVGNQKQKTKTHKKGGKNPSWQDSFAFELTGHESMISVECFDKDVFTADDFVAQSQINMEVFFHKRKGQQWFPMTRKGGKDGGQLLLDWEYKLIDMGGYKPPNTNRTAHNQNYRPPAQQPYHPPPQRQMSQPMNPFINQAANFMYQQRGNFGYQQPPPHHPPAYQNQPPPPMNPHAYGPPPGMPNLNYPGNAALNSFAQGINGALTPPPPPAYMRGQTGPNGVYGNNPPPRY